MEDTLVSFDTAKLAKEKGFKQWSTLKYPYWIQIDFNEKHKITKLIIDNLAKAGFQYDNTIENPIYYEAPTQSLLQKWLRDVHKLHIRIDTYTADKMTFTIYELSNIVIIRYLSGRNINDIDTNKNFLTYEQALEKGLQAALKLIK